MPKQQKLRRSATPNTLAYIQKLVHYKRTHIEREQERLDELLTMQAELEAIVR